MNGNRAICLGVFAAMCVFISGCASGSGPRAKQGVSPETPPSIAPEPIVVGAREGLEVTWWIADDQDGTVGSVLASFSPESPSSELIQDDLARLEASGLRLVRLPVSQFEPLMNAIPPVQPRYRRWVGWVTQWTEVFRGRRIGGNAPIIVADERRLLPRGIVRLLARSWPSPPKETGGPPRVRIELAIQIFSPEAQPDPFSTPSLAKPETQGLIIRELVVNFEASPGSIYVLTSEEPSVVWKASQKRETAESAAGFAPPPIEVDENESAPTAFPTFGPPVESLRTIGQAMMSSSAEENGSRSIKAILVLYPREPKSYRLLP